MMVKIMSNSKRIKEKVRFYVSGLAGTVQIYYGVFSFEGIIKQSQLRQFHTLILKNIF